MPKANSITHFLLLFVLAGSLFAQSAPPTLKSADQIEASKKMLGMLAVDGRINQLVSELRQLQEQNAANRKEFEEWQAKKRKEYSASEDQSITLDLQWSQPQKPTEAPKK